MERSRFEVFAFSLFLLSSAASVISGTQPSQPYFGTISGKVRDIDGRTITNVTIYLTNDTITTFEDAEAAGLALVGPDVSLLFSAPEMTKGEASQPILHETHYVLKNIPPGTYTVNARALREDGKVISGRAVNVAVTTSATATADIVLDVARPYTMFLGTPPTM
jgi:hypothetical protein